MDTNIAKGFTEELKKEAALPLLLGAALGGTALGYGGYKKYQEHKKNQQMKKSLRARQANTNRLGQLTPRMNPQML